MAFTRVGHSAAGLMGSLRAASGDRMADRGDRKKETNDNNKDGARTRTGLAALPILLLDYLTKQ